MVKRNVPYLVVLLALALGADAPPVYAQAPQAATGTLTGRVTLAASGDPVHAATITVVGVRRETKSGDDGNYQIENIPPGTYEVVVQRDQLSTAKQTVTIVAGQTAKLDFALSVGVHESVTVTASATGATTTFESFNSIISVDSTAIARRVAASLADVLQNEPGLAKRTFGPGSSRPIIRGFDGDRVLVMQDGMRTGDLSSQSGDHGVSIDPAGLARVEIVKGPATLLYGSNAIGGVVNAITPQEMFRSQPFSGLLGGVSFDAGSANTQTGFAGNVQRGKGPMLLFGSFTGRRTSDYDAPDLTVPNSGTRLLTGEAGFGWTGSRAYFGLSAGIERNRYGVPFGGLLEGEEDAEIDIDARRHNVRFDTGVHKLGGFADSFRLKGSYVDYRHDELETEDGTETLGTRLNNRVVTVRAELEQKTGRRVSGRLGGELLFRDYKSAGAEVLTPPTTQTAFAVFAYEEVTVGKHRLQFGGRAERVAYDPDVQDGPPARDFNAVSGSVGAHFNLGGNTAVVANLTGASRAPALEELYNFGPHPGNLAFEIGNSDLDLERTLGLDLSVRGRTEKARAELNVFAYNISNFVFLDVTDDIEDGLRVSNYVQGDSRFRGLDGSVHFHVGERIEVGAGLSFVRAKLRATNEFLPRIPPLQGRVELGINIKDFTITPEVVLAARQDRVFRHESDTAGWATGNLSVTWQRSQQHSSHLIAFQVHNIGNKTYRLHTSFLKDLAPEIGRGAKVTYTVRFF